MPIYHIYHGKDKVTSVLGDCIDEYSTTRIIWELKENVRDKQIALIPLDYLIVIEEIVRQDSGNSPVTDSNDN